MDAQRWARIESLYHAAMAKAPGERGDYLAEACAHEPDVRREVESLLLGASEPSAAAIRPHAAPSLPSCVAHNRRKAAEAPAAAARTRR